MRKTSGNIKPGDNLFLNVDSEDGKETRHKLAPTAEGPLPVTKINKETKFIIERLDRSVERVSRSRVLLAPAPIPQSELKPISNAMSINDITEDYSTSESRNHQHTTK